MPLIQIRGNVDIMDKTITGQQVSDSAAIPEVALTLDYSTSSLKTEMVSQVRDSEVQPGTKLIITELYWRDSVNGKVYKFTSRDGVLVAEEVTI